MHASAGRWQVALGDVHTPHENKLDEVLAAIAGCDDLVLLGDFMDLAWASHWNEALFTELGRHTHRQHLYREFDYAKEVLAKIRRKVRKARLWYVPGNHEAWLFYACFYHHLIALPWHAEELHYKTDLEDMKNKALASLLASQLETKKFGMRVLPLDEPLYLGPILYLHGHQFGGKNHINQAGLKYPHTSLVYAHHHTHKANTLFNSGDPKRVYEHRSIPGLCPLLPGYLKSKSTCWLNGFWSCRFERGFYSGEVVKVFEGKIASKARL